MSKINRKRVYDNLVTNKYYYKISDSLKAEFGEPHIPQPKVVKPKPKKVKNGNK